MGCRGVCGFAVRMRLGGGSLFLAEACNNSADLAFIINVFR